MMLCWFVPPTANTSHIAESALTSDAPSTLMMPVDDLFVPVITALTIRAQVSEFLVHLSDLSMPSSCECAQVEKFGQWERALFRRSEIHS
jgi:hypothetical protein